MPEAEICSRSSNWAAELGPRCNRGRQAVAQQRAPLEGERAVREEVSARAIGLY